ncbi:MAG: universal stress protein [Salinarimonadaceae bacterium]|nr:MAG: universal stress protein [Salinarimonadaceae bacterium]
MSEPQLLDHARMGSLPHCSRGERQIFRHVLACVDGSSFADDVLAHAAAVALAADARMTVIRVLESSDQRSPMDPVKWTLRHRDVQAHLREQAALFADRHAETVIVDGPAAERICAWTRDHAVDLTVLGRCGESDGPFAGLGGTARRVAEIVSGSVLIVPPKHVGAASVRYRRVLTPLDGSSRSECALPLALGIAAAHGSEMILVHAVPSVDLTEAGPLEAEDVSLRDRLRARNERAAEGYMRQVRSRLPSVPSTRVRVLPSGDPRHALARAALDEGADLMVLSRTGQSGHPDMPVGSVADYLINHVNIPVLLVGGRETSPPIGHRRLSEAMAVRLPRQALL